MGHTLTWHARERIASRSAASERDVLEMLDDEKYVPLGVENGSNREHDLLYSIFDSL